MRHGKIDGIKCQYVVIRFQQVAESVRREAPEIKRFQVKRLVVKPGAQMSLQLHHHRAEHWIVVSGTARITRGEETFLLGENESTFIPVGMKHRLENPGAVPLEIIEVRSGTYLGEDDIVRFEERTGPTGRA